MSELKKLSPSDIELIRDCMFWTSEAWSKPFIELLQNNKLISQAETFIEIGAGSQSSLSPFFLSLGKKTTCSYFFSDISEYYSEDYLEEIKVRNDYILEKHKIRGEIEYRKMDIFELQGEYDIIFLKSILGGLFRYGQGSISDANSLIASLTSNNLTTEGQLITIDNGRSFFEGGLERLGQRKNKWRYFNKSDLKGYSQLYFFGFVTAFSIKTRNLFLGIIFEKIMYFIDLILERILDNNTPTVILKVFKKE